MRLQKISGLMLSVFLGAAMTVQAQEHAGHDMASMAADSPVSASEITVPDSTAAFKASDMKMHKAMMQTYTGDADVDFLRGMIPHHQGAVDMAKVVLKYGSDADVKMFANDIIKAQEKEILWMKNWLALHGPKDATASGMRADGTPDEVTLPAVRVVEPKPVVARPVVVVPAVLTQVVKTTISSTVVSGTVSPPSPTVFIPSVGTTAALMLDGMPRSLTPDLPAPEDAIINDAPRMELLEDTLPPAVGEPTDGR